MFVALFLLTCTIGLLCWLLYTLASFALPLLMGAFIGQFAWHAGYGLSSSLLIGAVTAGGTLFAGQFLFAVLRNPISRTSLCILFTAPAALAGFNAGRGAAATVGMSPVAQLLFGCTAGFCVAIAAMVRLARAQPTAYKASSNCSQTRSTEYPPNPLPTFRP